MQTFFARQEEELEDGSVQVTYSGFGSTEYVLVQVVVVTGSVRDQLEGCHVIFCEP